MGLQRLVFSVDANQKIFITTNGTPLADLDLPKIEYGTYFIVELNYFDVDLTSETPVTQHAFDPADLGIFRGDNDLTLDDQLMFLAEEINGSPALWVAATEYVLGTRITSTAGDWYICIVAGTSGGSEPTWDTDIDDTTTDGTVTWRRVENSDGVNIAGDYTGGGTANKTLGQWTFRLYTGTTKFQTFLSTLTIDKYENMSTLVQMFIVASGTTRPSCTLSSPFWGVGLLDSTEPVPSPVNPDYITATAIASGYVSRSLFNLQSPTVNTIASDAITRVGSVIKLEPESVATDNLATINGMIAGESVVAMLNDITDTITIKHGTGNILIPNGSDYAFTGNGFIWFYHDGTNIQTLLVAPISDDDKQDKVSEEYYSANQVLTNYAGRRVIYCSNTIDLTLPSAVGATDNILIINEGSGVITLKMGQAMNGSAADRSLPSQYMALFCLARSDVWLQPNLLFP